MFNDCPYYGAGGVGWCLMTALTMVLVGVGVVFNDCPYYGAGGVGWCLMTALTMVLVGLGWGWGGV